MHFRFIFFTCFYFIITVNNAIEACEKCEEKKTIKLKFVIEENLIVLSVKNTCSNPIIYSDNEIKTSKKDRHGAAYSAWIS